MNRLLTKVWTVQQEAEMLEQVKNQTYLIEVLERLCLAVENLRKDLRPELKKTETLERKKREQAEIKTAAAQAVRNRKRPQQSST